MGPASNLWFSGFSAKPDSWIRVIFQDQWEPPGLFPSNNPSYMCSYHAVSRQFFFGKKTYFEQILGSGPPPLGVKTPLNPPPLDQNPGFAPDVRFGNLSVTTEFTSAMQRGAERVTRPVWPGGGQFLKPLANRLVSARKVCQCLLSFF